MPYTALGVVDIIITEMGVMEVTKEGLLLTELYPNYTLNEIKNATGCELIISNHVKDIK